MKTLPFLLLLACLLNTALSHPTGCWPFKRRAARLARHPDPNTVVRGSFPATAVSRSADSPLSHPTGCWPFKRRAARLARHPGPNTVVRGSFPATAVSRSADSPLEAATEVSFPAVDSVLCSSLPIEIVSKILSHADFDFETKCSLRTTNSAVRAALQWSSADIEKIKKSHPKFKAFYQAIIKNDIDAVKRLYQIEFTWIIDHYALPDYVYGLELAVRYNSPQAAWILLACETLQRITNTEEHEKLRRDAEMRQTETGLANLAIIRRATNRHEREFFQKLILNRQREAYSLGLEGGLTKAARISGLKLAVQYGTNMNILVLLAFSTWDWDMDSKEIKEIVNAAMGKLSQTNLDFLIKIENSSREEQHFWRNIVSERSVQIVIHQTRRTMVIDHDTAIVGMQLAVMSGKSDVVMGLLRWAAPTLERKLNRAAAELATNADKSENLQEIWERMKYLMEREELEDSEDSETDDSETDDSETEDSETEETEVSETETED